MGQFIAVVTGEDRLRNSDYAMTLEEIGQQLGITRERVRQIEAAALNKLRKYRMAELLEMREMANELGRRRGLANGVVR